MSNVEHTQLRKGALGVGFIVFFIISAAGPLAAISGGIPIGMMLGNGAGLPFLLLMTVIVLIVFAAGYTAMARYVVKAGGFYSFIAAAFGPGAGAASASVALLAYNAMQIGLYGLFGVAAQALVKDVTGLVVDWWIWCFLALASIAVFGYRQVDLSAKVLGTVVALEYLVVLILDIAILHGAPSEQITMQPFTFDALMSGAPAIAVLFCFAAFVGFESATIYSEEARNPSRTIPLATYISVVLIGGFYTFSTWCLIAGIGPTDVIGVISGLSDPTLFTFDLANRYAGSWLASAMSVLFVTSVYAALLAFHNATARYFFTGGREGILPQHMCRTHPKHKSPHIGSMAQTVIAALVLSIFAVAELDPVLTLFTWLTNLATLSIMALMALTSFAIIRFFRLNRGLVGITRGAIMPAISGVILAIVFLMALANFDLLLGSNGQAVWVLPSLIPLVALIGWLRSREKFGDRHGI